MINATDAFIAYADMVEPEPEEPTRRDDSGVVRLFHLAYQRVTNAVEKANRRAKKLGLPPVTLEDHGTETIWQSREGRPYLHGRLAYRVRLTGQVIENPGGWAFLAAITHGAEGNLVASPPEVELAGAWANAPARCDHCGLTRQRAKTYLVVDPAGVTKQVGHDCLASYTQSIDPVMVAYYLDLVELMRRETGGPGAGVDVLDTRELVTIAAAVIRQQGGYTPRDAYAQSTASLVMEVIDPPVREAWDRRVPYTVTLEPADYAAADAAIAWAAENTESTDFATNLRYIARQPAVTPRQVGLACVLPWSYAKAMGYEDERRKKAEARAALPDSSLVGTVGQRMPFGDCVVVRARQTEGNYGTTTITGLRTSAGADLTWFASGAQDYAEGDTLVGLVGTVKAHGEYQGRPQTTVTRCKYASVTPAPEPA